MSILCPTRGFTSCTQQFNRNIQYVVRRWPDVSEEYISIIGVEK
jgi:hypothetical protein